MTSPDGVAPKEIKDARGPVTETNSPIDTGEQEIEAPRTEPPPEPTPP